MYRDGDIENILLSLGIETSQRNNELIGLCPMHLERTGREDSNPSWSMNAETGVHHCFSCGYKGSLLSLIGEIKEFTTTWGRIDYDAAKDWLKNYIHVDFEFLSKQLEEARNTYIPVQNYVGMSEARLAVFDDVPPQWALDARDLTAEACEFHGVKWNKANNSWITPIRDPQTHGLMGWQEKSQTQRFFRNRPPGVAKSKTLFGIEKFTGGTMIVVESPLDAVKLTSLGITGAVASFGAMISDAQLSLMRAADKLIFAFDNPRIDEAGKKAAKDIMNRIRRAGMECWFLYYPDDDYKDIGDMPKHLVQLSVEGSKYFLFGEGAFL